MFNFDRSFINLQSLVQFLRWNKRNAEFALQMHELFLAFWQLQPFLLLVKFHVFVVDAAVVIQSKEAELFKDFQLQNCHVRRHEKEETVNLSQAPISYILASYSLAHSHTRNQTHSLSHSFNRAQLFNASLPYKVKTFASHVIRGWVKASMLLTLSSKLTHTRSFPFLHSLAFSSRSFRQPPSSSAHSLSPPWLLFFLLLQQHILTHSQCSTYSSALPFIKSSPV